MDIVKLFEGGFPLTTETLAFLQNSYTKPLNALANMAGDNVILEGLVLDAGNLSAGYIIHNGEILPFRAGTVGANINIVEKIESVEYEDDEDNDGEPEIKEAYVTRTATTGGALTGETIVETFAFSGLVRISNFKNYMPLGSAVLWFDAVNIPAGWRVMDGSGGTVNGVPARDLRNMFVKMAGSEQLINTTNGSRTKTLVLNNIPAHTHNAPAHTHPTADGLGGLMKFNGGVVTALGIKTDNDFWVELAGATGSGGGGATSSTGSGTAFNIEPLHYSALWIQFIGL